MFELFMMCLFATAGMLLGNLVFNCIVALSDSIETNLLVESKDKRKHKLTPAIIKASEIITKNKLLDK